MNIFSSNFNYVGYLDQNNIAKNLFSNNNISKISSRISNILKDNFNLNIIVSDRVIIGVLNQYFQNYIPNQIGDIYTKDTQSKLYVNELEKMIEQVIYFIISSITMENIQQYKNSQLTIWNDSRSNWNDYIKIREKRPNRFSWIPAGQLGNNIPQMN